MSSMEKATWDEVMDFIGEEREERLKDALVKEMKGVVLDSFEELLEEGLVEEKLQEVVDEAIEEVLDVIKQKVKGKALEVAEAAIKAYNDTLLED